VFDGTLISSIISHSWAIPTGFSLLILNAVTVFAVELCVSDSESIQHLVDEPIGSSNPTAMSFFASSVSWIISGLDLREPLHADGVDLSDPVLERRALNLILDLAIPQGAFEGDEFPLLESLGEHREISPGIDAMPFGAGFVIAFVVLPAFLGCDVEDNVLNAITSSMRCWLSAPFADGRGPLNTYRGDPNARRVLGDRRPPRQVRPNPHRRHSGVGEDGHRYLDVSGRTGQGQLLRSIRKGGRIGEGLSASSASAPMIFAAKLWRRNGALGLQGVGHPVAEWMAIAWIACAPPAGPV
jgi:hypothetical protein